jgi:hypothetical protein
MEGKTALLAADLVLFVHLSYVMFVIVGLLLIWLGRWRGWTWVRNPWFRLGHVVAILIVAVSAWFHLDCPLTVLENDLRARGGDAGYDGSFMAHWMREILFYQGPPWAFTLAYSVFGLLVIGSWFAVRPRSFR